MKKGQMARRSIVACWIAISLLVVVSCNSQSLINQSFNVSFDDAKSAWHLMQEQPRGLDRPLIVLGGIFDAGAGARDIADQIREIASLDSPIISVAFSRAYTFDECAARVIETVENTWPSDDLHQTIEVDVVASSMGGLVARHAARQPPDESGRKRLRIARLFTISTPHCGAVSSFNHPADQRISDMRPGSRFIQELNSMPGDYELYCYVLLNDGVVGEDYAAPPGCNPWWLANEPLTSSHTKANDDVRILADIARRLRGEPPFSTCPPAALPPRHHVLKYRI